MPFGLINAPSTFQKIIDEVLSGMIGSECFVYIDDIIVYSSTLEEHLTKLRHVLEQLLTYRLYIQPDKSEFLHSQLPYLGYIITEHGITPNPEKFSKIKNFPQPKDTKAIQQFLGLAGFYRRFIPKYSDVAKPLSSLLKKDTEFVWTEDCQKSLDSLNEKITSPDLMLAYPDFEKTFFLYTDASNQAIGAVLQQKDDEGHFRPISYASRTLKQSRTGYATIEKELLALSLIHISEPTRPY